MNSTKLHRARTIQSLYIAGRKIHVSLTQHMVLEFLAENPGQSARVKDLQPLFPTKAWSGKTPSGKPKLQDIAARDIEKDLIDFADAFYQKYRITLFSIERNFERPEETKIGLNTSLALNFFERYVARSTTPRANLRTQFPSHQYS